MVRHGGWLDSAVGANSTLYVEKAPRAGDSPPDAFVLRRVVPSSSRVRSAAVSATLLPGN
jgi:hypothetical protein